MYRFARLIKFMLTSHWNPGAKMRTGILGRKMTPPVHLYPSHTRMYTHYTVCKFTGHRPATVQLRHSWVRSPHLSEFRRGRAVTEPMTQRLRATRGQQRGAVGYARGQQVNTPGHLPASGPSADSPVRRKMTGF